MESVCLSCCILLDGLCCTQINRSHLVLSSFAGDVLEVKAAPSDNHAVVTGPGPPSREDMH